MLLMSASLCLALKAIPESEIGFRHSLVDMPASAGAGVCVQECACMSENVRERKPVCECVCMWQEDDRNII